MGQDYQAFYCEENIVRLLLARAERPEEPWWALFIANAAGACPMWSQRAAQPPGAAVVWDYHVVAAQGPVPGAQIWDLDSTLGCPVPFERWFAATFPPLASLLHGLPPMPDYPTRLHPRFRLVPREELLSTFGSDRGHMREVTTGAWLQPPPPWEPLLLNSGQETNLVRFLDMSDVGFVGEVLDAREVVARLGG